MPKWEVVGGGDKGGILVRSGQDLKSPQVDPRLSTGAVVEQLELAGDRLKYKLISGTGPAEGWVSTKLSGKDLLTLKEEPAAPAAPTDPAEWASYLASTIDGPSVATTIRAAAPWVSAIGKPPPKAKVRLVIFTWTGNRGGAGSAHNFTKWPKMLQELSPPETWECAQVNYPGRGSRMKEANSTDATVVAGHVADALEKAGPLPTVLFGFSFGAILAYETACAMAKRKMPLLGLTVASAEYPTWPGRGKGVGPDGGATKDLAPDKFEAVLHEKGGTEVILQSPDMKKMYLPVILADMVMEEAYGSKPPENPPLACPVVVFRGKDDPIVAKAEAEGWLKATGVEGSPSRVEEIATELKPFEQSPWLCDWYLCQGEPSTAAMVKALATDFGGAKK